MKEFTVNRNDSGQRLDKYLLKSIPLLPSSLMHKYIRLKRIKLNGKRCQANTILNPGDVLTLYINDEFFEVSSHSYGFLSSPSDIDIVYEDENILLADKKPGLVVHEDESGSSDTLINRIQQKRTVLLRHCATV